MSWLIFTFIYFGRVHWLLRSVWKGGGRAWLSTSSLTAPSGLVTNCQFRLHLNLTSLHFTSFTTLYFLSTFHNKQYSRRLLAPWFPIFIFLLFRIPLDCPMPIADILWPHIAPTCLLGLDAVPWKAEHSVAYEPLIVIALEILNAKSSWRRLGLWHCKLKTQQK
jgi:hypothetical protein